VQADNDVGNRLGEQSATTENDPGKIAAAHRAHSA